MREPNKNFLIGARVRLGCVMSPWLFDIFRDGCMKAQVGNVGTRLKINRMSWWWHACL